MFKSWSEGTDQPTIHFSRKTFIYRKTYIPPTKTAYANHDSLAASYESENVEETVLSEDSEIYRADCNIKLNR